MFAFPVSEELSTIWLWMRGWTFIPDIFMYDKLCCIYFSALAFTFILIAESFIFKKSEFEDHRTFLKYQKSIVEE